MKFYKPGNVLRTAAYYVGTAAVAAGAVTVAPVWALVVAGVFAGGITVLSVKAQNNFLKENLVRHPDSHPFSPNLGKMVQELYRKSGLKAEDYPVYDFKVDHQKVRAGGPIKKMMAEVFNKMSQTHNAAAVRFDKPLIMISEPLLKLLNDDEEKAVLAHEFTHAAARHHHVGILPKLAGSVSALSTSLAQFPAIISAGLKAILLSMGWQWLAGKVFDEKHKKSDLLSQRDDDLNVADLQEKRKAAKLKSTIVSLTGSVVLSLFSTAYLKIWAVAKGVSIISKLMTSAFSRNNEFQADRGATLLGANPLALITGLRKIHQVQKESLQKAVGGGSALPKAGALSRFWKQANTTHPKLENRIRKLEKIARRQGYSEADIQQASKAPIVIPPGNDMPPDLIRSLSGF